MKDIKSKILISTCFVSLGALAAFLSLNQDVSVSPHANLLASKTISNTSFYKMQNEKKTLERYDQNLPRQSSLPAPNHSSDDVLSVLTNGQLSLDDEDILNAVAFKIQNDADLRADYLQRLEGARNESERRLLRDILFRVDDTTKIEMVDVLRTSQNLENRRDAVEILGTLSSLPTEGHQIFKKLLATETNSEILPWIFSTAEDHMSPELRDVIEPGLRSHYLTSDDGEVRRRALFSLVRMKPYDLGIQQMALSDLASNDTDRLSDSFFAITLILENIKSDPSHPFRRKAEGELKFISNNNKISADDRTEANAILTTYYDQ